MHRYLFLSTLTVCTALALSSCSSNNDTSPTDTSEFNPDAPPAQNTGEPGGDISAIAGLWDGTTSIDEQTDVVYWNLAANGVLTRFDYQQDGTATATGENCYIVDEPITVTPEDGDSYSIFNVAVSAVRSQDTLTIAFQEPDRNDVDANGNSDEMPTFSWNLLTTPTLADLNDCAISAQSLDTENLDDPATQAVDSDPLPAAGEQAVSSANDGDTALEPTQDIATERLALTGEQCESRGGRVIGDIGNGAVHRPEYRCESGMAPIARIIFPADGPIASEGAVCCL